MRNVGRVKISAGTDSHAFEPLEPRVFFSANVIQLLSSGLMAGESASSNLAKVLVKRTGDVRRSLVVSLDTRGTAMLGEDYSLRTDSRPLQYGKVRFTPGQHKLWLTVSVIDDEIAEKLEFLKIFLKPANTYRIDKRNRSAQITISDNEPTVRVAAMDSSASETAATDPLDTAAFRIMRSGSALSQELIVFYRLSGTASADDYTMIPSSSISSITIPAGASHVDLVIAPVNDGELEQNEQLILSLTDSTQYWLGASAERSAMITIEDFIAPPVPELRTPGDYSTLWGDNLIEGRIIGGRDARSARYWFDDASEDSVLLNLDASGKFNQEIDLWGVLNGQHKLFVEASDANGLRSKISLDVSVDVHQIYGLNFGPYIQPGEAPGVTVLTPAQVFDRLRSVARHTQWVRFFSTRDGLEHAGMLAHQLGFPLPKDVAYGLWNWEKLWKECGWPRGPGYNS